jgi:UDP-galactopyranose mutase
MERYSNLFFTGRNAAFTHMDIDDNFESALNLHDNLLQMATAGNIGPLSWASVRN